MPCSAHGWRRRTGVQRQAPPQRLFENTGAASQPETVPATVFAARPPRNGIARDRCARRDTSRSTLPGRGSATGIDRHPAPRPGREIKPEAAPPIRIHVGIDDGDRRRRGDHRFERVTAFSQGTARAD